jgi:PAS domain-containing protein
VLAKMPNAFFSLDTSLTITYVNAEGERLLRTPRDAVLGTRFIDAFPEDVGSEFELRYQHAIETGQSVIFQEYYAPFDGWFEFHAWPDRFGVNV